MMVSEVLDEMGTPNDFIGHAGGDNFIIITAEESANGIRERLKNRFAEEMLSHYSFIDREQGYTISTNKEGKREQTPLMRMAVGIVTPTEYQFADIREITELAAESRRRDSQ